MQFSWCFDVFIRQYRWDIQGVEVRRVLNEVRKKTCSKLKIGGGFRISHETDLLLSNGSWVLEHALPHLPKPSPNLVPIAVPKYLSRDVIDWLYLKSNLVRTDNFKLEQAIWDKEPIRNRSETPSRKVQPPSVAGDVTSHNQTMTILMTF